MTPRVSIIVAMASNRVIGANNALPWHLPADLNRFKSLTMGHHIIMGRKTFESIGRVLPGRASVVVTRNPAWKVDGAITASSLRDAIAKAKGDDEIFVIGGEQIFREALPLADRIYLTQIERDFAGDVHFPPLAQETWSQKSSESGSDEASGLRYSYKTLERVRQ
ncbi:MAG TPA: dihydrofolate reductase [Burkholderiales bacterium]|nr:dihydrofolate reductase [Burkholderiales bacterium]